MWSNCILIAWHMCSHVFIPAGIPIPSNPVLGEPLFCGAAGCHGQTPPHHPGQQTAHQAPQWQAAERAAVSWGTKHTQTQPNPFFKDLWLSHFLMKKLHQWPSPQELKGRILVKGKKHTPHLGQMGKTSSSASFSSSSDDELTSSSKNTPTKDPAKVSSARLVIKPEKLLTQTLQLIDQFSFMLAFAFPRSVLNWAQSYQIWWCTAKASLFMALKMHLKNHQTKCPPSLRVTPSSLSKTRVQQSK